MAMDAILEKAAVVRFQNWPATIAILLVVAVAAVLLSAGNRVAFPKTAPTYISRGGYPILGMWRFFSDRRNFMLSSSHSTKTGNFSFYFGKHQIVGLAGTEGRRTFFDSKDLNFAIGYAVLFANTPQIDENDKDENPLSFNRWFTSTIVSMMRKENFVRNLPILVGDTQKQLAAIVDANGGKTTGVFDPFDNLYRTVYQLTMRTVGADDIAEDPVLLAKTLRLFEKIDAASSPTRVIFPWLPTPGHIKRVTAGIRLYSIFNNIAENRRKTGRRGEDAFQFLLDSGESITKILTVCHAHQLQPQTPLTTSSLSSVHYLLASSTAVSTLLGSLFALRVTQSGTSASRTKLTPLLRATVYPQSSLQMMSWQLWLSNTGSLSFPWSTCAFVSASASSLLELHSERTSPTRTSLSETPARSFQEVPLPHTRSMMCT